jgi:Major Facilitator Superfamily
MGDVSPEAPEAPRRRWWGRRPQIVDRAGFRADAMLDRAQRRVFRFMWTFVPEPEIARDIRFEHLLASRFLSDAGQQSILFGALVSVARGGGSALEVALVGVSALLPPAVLGLYGGAVADAIPRRVALAGVYALQALLCFVFPGVVGTGLLAVMLLLFAINTLGQVSGPTESAVLPIVANDAQLASAASLINLASAAGTAFGTAVLAPIVVRIFGVDLVFYMAGVMLLLAASRVFDLPVDEKGRAVKLPPLGLRFRPTVNWLIEHPAVATMIIFSTLAGTVNIVLLTLAPRYVEEVLHADAANAAYVFAPSAVGIVLGLVIAPTLMRLLRERLAAIIGLLIAAISLFLLGLIDDVASVIDPFNPIRITEPLGIISERVRTAGILALPLALGVSLTITSVQTYINRRVPLAYQGRTFAMQSALRNGAAIIPLITLGSAAAVFGTESVLLVSPIVLLVVGYALVYYSYRYAGIAQPSALEVVATFWEEPEGPTVDEMRDPG